RKNLLLGVPVYGISSDSILGNTFETDYYNTKESVAKLTDGKKAEKAECGDSAFFHFTRGVGRSVVFKLDGLSAVDEIKIGFLREDSTGIKLPRRCDVLISENGADWQRIVKACNLKCPESPQRFELSQSFGTPYKALYILVEFEVPCHTWIDEIEVFGTEAIPENAISVKAEAIEENPSIMHVNKYPEYDDFLNVRNLLLSYNCVPPEKVGEKGLGLITEEQYIPHLAYIDRDGKMTDTFFDSFLYLPYSVYTYSYLYKCAEGWRYYVDNVFAKDRNLDALDKAAATVGEKLGIENHQVQVFFSILCSKVRYGEFPEKFGDLDGDGTDEDMSTLRDRKKALKWIIDEHLNRYKEKNYKNVTLGGFYWFEEDINYSDEFELDLIAYAREYLHSLGLKFFWIPYFQAWGFQDWKENGFDIACMQPNYAFRKDETVQRLYDNASITKALGMCVELEIGGLKPDDIERYKCYLDAGEETGYMNTIKMYYQGGVPGEFYRAYKSEDPLTRSVYDDTYLFAKEKYVSRKRR
ncbi:MAG: DUF4855 domain-containing protein, partial [Eubacteriales bacterium]|nr:DUF4855 domain-containing protein [Eubacteriales bacterium]